MAQAAGPFDPILDPLDAVAARRRIRALIRLALACALAMLAAAALLALAARGGYVSPPPLPTIAAIGMVTAALAGLLAWARRRTRTEEAFFIDRSGGFDQAYGTAVELAGNSARVNAPVPAELMRAVHDDLGAISPARLVRIFTPGFVFALILALGLAAAVAWIVRQPVPSTPPAALEAATAEPADSETLSTIVEMLAQDAQERDDPLLEAIARTLAERTQSPGTERLTPELQRQINDLLDQAAAAYGEDAPRWLGESEGMRLNELEKALAAMEANQAAAAPTTPLDPVAVRGDDIQATPQGPGMYELRPELAEQYASRDNDEMMAGAELLMGEPPTDLGGSAPPGQGPQLMEPQQLQSIGSIPVGAALDSGRGVSNAAGLGEQDLQADDTFTHLGATPGEDMVVSAQPQAQGSRIRIEIVPQTAEGASAGAANRIGGQTGSGSTEPVSRDFIPSSARDVAARYFERLAQ